ncbi:MAG TPA: GHKL domain-containing protein [Syntrophomonadaceae bacterium]|nr:GHKL domain-containing protein [Syntrophomonadaceae bacterium]
MNMNKRNTIRSLLGLGVILAVLGIFCLFHELGQPVPITRHVMLIPLLFVIIIGISLSLALTRKLLVITKQEQTMDLQKLHIDHLQEMMRVIETQRHDYINHLHTVYGLMTLGEVEQARHHISELYHEVKIKGEVLKVSLPEVTALLMVKMGVATSRNISVKVKVESDLSGIKVRSLDIVAILGNMINNALEAVEDLQADQKQIELTFSEDSDYFYFQTHNPGFIPEGFQSKVFEPGFSTKDGPSNRGLGLASIGHLVRQYKGQVLLHSNPDEGTTLTVSFPK